METSALRRGGEEDAKRNPHDEEEDPRDDEVGTQIIDRWAVYVLEVGVVGSICPSGAWVGNLGNRGKHGGDKCNAHGDCTENEFPLC